MTYSDKQTKIIDTFCKLFAETKKEPTVPALNKAGVTRHAIQAAFATKDNLAKEARAARPDVFKTTTEAKYSDAQLRILTAYVNFIEENGHRPSTAQLVACGITRNMVRSAFGNPEGLHEAAQEWKSEAFNNTLDESIFTEERFLQLQSEVRKYKNFVVTTAVTGCKVEEKFYSALKHYCAKHNAMLLVLLASDPAAVNFHGTYLDPTLENENIVFDDLPLNQNLFLSAIKLSAKHIDPITGLGRIGQRDGSFIFASPKQRLKMVATGNVGFPHALMTTGACTSPAYDSDRYMSNRTAYIADKDHKLGALIVNVENNKLFHFRQVQADETGAFADLGRLYEADGSVSAYAPEALVLGDWHSGETDPVAAGAFVFNADSLTALTKPKSVFIHDGFDGKSISHHEEKNRVRRAQLAALNKNSLADELENYGKDLNAISKHFEHTYIVDSNHDDFLERYLREGRFIEDPRNAEIASLLFHHMIKGEDPLAFALSDKLDDISKFTFLARDEDFKIAGIELAAHGDLGANGSKGSTKQMEAAYGSSMSGHTHTPEILRDAWTVGCLCNLRQNYTRGASSWMLTSGLVYPCGRRQLINVIDGKFLPPKVLDTTGGLP